MRTEQAAHPSVRGTEIDELHSQLSGKLFRSRVEASNEPVAVSFSASVILGFGRFSGDQLRDAYQTPSVVSRSHRVTGLSIGIGRSRSEQNLRCIEVEDSDNEAEYQHLETQAREELSSLLIMRERSREGLNYAVASDGLK